MVGGRIVAERPSPRKIFRMTSMIPPGPRERLVRSYPVLVTEKSRTPQPPAVQPPAVQPARLPASALSAVTGSKRGPEPLDPPMVPFVLAGLGMFLLAGLLALVFRGWLTEHGHTGWLWTCVAGFLAGLPALALMVRHDRHRRAHRALTHPEVKEL
jgi:hypothetical protein